MSTLVEAIPEELQRLNRWLCCDSGSKRPIRPSDGRAASVTRESDWGNFADACSLVESGFCSHIGFVFANDGYVGIDIDHAFTDEGLLSDEASMIIRACSSYTEVSKSGSGIHIICKGKLPFAGKNNRAGYEIYASGRWFVLTGQRVGRMSLCEAQSGIDLTLERHFQDEAREGVSSPRSERIWTPIWPEIVGRRIPVEPTYPKVQSGARHISLVSFCGQKWSSGCEPHQLLASARRANRLYIEPPLDDGEVTQIATSVMKYRR